MSERTFPHNIEAERAVLGAVLVQSERLLDVSWLQPRMFYRLSHQRVWAAMRRMAEANTAIDVVTLRAELEKVGDLESVGGMAYVLALADGVPRSSNIEHYATIVREAWMLRELMRISKVTMDDAERAEDAAHEVLAKTEQRIYELAAGTERGELVPASALSDQVQTRLLALAESRSNLLGHSTGLVDLDGLTRGLQGKTLIILAARPSMGKTALALNIATHVARTVGPVAFFSLEMGHEELLQRQVTSDARISLDRVMSGQLSDHDYARLNAAAARVKSTKLWVDETPDTTVLEIRSKARRMKAREGLALVIVDYLQLLGTAEKSENRNLELGAMTRAFKNLSKELDVPVMVLSQLNRNLEARGDKRPTLGDLRESGAIEQDADQVIFIYRDEVYVKDTPDQGIAELIIAKHRNGATGIVRVRFAKHETRFENLARHEEAA
jgi:replicative DNA helicase